MLDNLPEPNLDAAPRCIRTLRNTDLAPAGLWEPNLNAAPKTLRNPTWKLHENLQNPMCFPHRNLAEPDRDATPESCESWNPRWMLPRNLPELHQKLKKPSGTRPSRNLRTLKLPGTRAPDRNGANLGRRLHRIDPKVVLKNEGTRHLQDLQRPQLNQLTLTPAAAPAYGGWLSSIKRRFYSSLEVLSRSGGWQVSSIGKCQGS